MLLRSSSLVAKRFLKQWSLRKTDRAGARVIAAWEAADRRCEVAERQERQIRERALEQNPDFIKFRNEIDMLVDCARQIDQGGETPALLHAALQVIDGMNYPRSDYLAHEYVEPRVSWFFATINRAGLKFSIVYECGARKLGYEPYGGWQYYNGQKYPDIVT